MLSDEFEAGARDEWQRPKQVIDALELRGDETVIDLGAGTGYFARYLIERAARLIAVDPVYCAHLQQRGFEAVERIEQLQDPVDLVFAANVLRFLEDEDRARIGALTSRIVLLDWKKGGRPVGPAEEEARSMDEALDAFPAFAAVPMPLFLPYQWMIELRKS